MDMAHFFTAANVRERVLKAKNDDEILHSVNLTLSDNFQYL
jgi:hypothetical protein